MLEAYVRSVFLKKNTQKIVSFSSEMDLKDLITWNITVLKRYMS